MKKRDKIIKFKVNDEEYEQIMQKFRLSGGKSRSRFIRQMILEGMVISFSDEKMNRLLSLIGNVANNINQIAVRANSTGNVYEQDLKEITHQMNEIWKQQIDIHSLLRKLKP